MVLLWMKGLTQKKAVGTRRKEETREQEREEGKTITLCNHFIVQQTSPVLSGLQPSLVWISHIRPSTFRLRTDRGSSLYTVTIKSAWLFGKVRGRQA